ncbi:hypothetical protein CGCTS75_v000414 [Colletotrichum tropicale]|nr:hypothetical protein CGCTS75_v000414 [Colletotrichum tropicale]
MQSAQPHNVLLTGASGYLGGSLFAGLKSSGLSGYDRIYALVRSDAQKEAVQQYGAEPLSVSLKDAKAVRNVIVQNKISVVFYLIDVFESTAQENLIKALGDLRQTTGVSTLIPRSSKTLKPMGYDLTSLPRVLFTWPVCHISDNTALYLQILRSILEGKNIGHGRNDSYLAASGSIAWDDIYAALALALKVRGIIEDETVAPVDDIALVKMAQRLNTDPSLVAMRVGGKCTVTAEHGGQIGWSRRSGPTHILDAADAEVEHILRYLGHRAGKF